MLSYLQLQMKLSLREGEAPASGHTASEWAGYEPSSLAVDTVSGPLPLHRCACALSRRRFSGPS